MGRENEAAPGSSPTAARGRIQRRAFLQFAALLVLCPRLIRAAGAADPSTATNLLSAPLELTGDWGASPRQAAAIVITRVREVSLEGIRLLSDRQPDRVRVDEHSSGSPAIWLHDDPRKTAWIIVDIGGRDWCKLAYQFGHELGHVLANSWEATAKPQPPTQWLEEAMVEAFSLRGLGLLAASWEKNPPFTGDAPFAKAIRQYRADIIEGYRKPGQPKPGAEFADWFRQNRSALENGGGLTQAGGPAILAILAELERGPSAVEDLGALNRWPARSAAPLEQYLALWQASCAQLQSPGRLPTRLKTLFQLG
jgi:hypothetical protein